MNIIEKIKHRGEIHALIDAIDSTIHKLQYNTFTNYKKDTQFVNLNKRLDTAIDHIATCRELLKALNEIEPDRKHT